MISKEAKKGFEPTYKELKRYLKRPFKEAIERF